MSDEAVYLGYGQEELDAQYNNRARYPEYKGYFDDWTDWSAKTRARFPARLDVAYGDLPCGVNAVARFRLRRARHAGGGLEVYILIYHVFVKGETRYFT